MRKRALIKQSKLLQRLKLIFSQTYSVKSMGSRWENLTVLQLGLKGLMNHA